MFQELAEEESLCRPELAEESRQELPRGLELAEELPRGLELAVELRLELPQELEQESPQELECSVYRRYREFRQDRR
jgi:hypothetical protein